MSDDELCINCKETPPGLVVRLSTDRGERVLCPPCADAMDLNGQLTRFLDQAVTESVERGDLDRVLDEFTRDD